MFAHIYIIKQIRYAGLRPFVCAKLPMKAGASAWKPRVTISRNAFVNSGGSDHINRNRNVGLIDRHVEILR